MKAQFWKLHENDDVFVFIDEQFTTTSWFCKNLGTVNFSVLYLNWKQRQCESTCSLIDLRSKNEFWFRIFYFAKLKAVVSGFNATTTQAILILYKSKLVIQFLNSWWEPITHFESFYGIDIHKLKCIRTLN